MISRLIVPALALTLATPALAERGGDGELKVLYWQAATVLNRVLDLGAVEVEVWCADREAVPSWAAQAVGNMEALNVLSVGSFGSDRLETAVTRADAARMLSAAGTLLRGEKDTGLLGLLKKS